MLRKAYFLKKGNKKIGQFFTSQLELQEKYSDKLKKDGYSIGVMEFSHEEKADKREFVRLWVDNSGLNYNRNGEHFYANYLTCWGELPEVWHHEIEIDIRDIEEKMNSTTVKVRAGARVRDLGKYTNEDIAELRVKFETDFLEELKPLMVGENRIRLYVNRAGITLINDNWHTVSCYFLKEGEEPRNGHYLIEMDIDKARAGYGRGSIRANGTHHIKIIEKVSV